MNCSGSETNLGGYDAVAHLSDMTICPADNDAIETADDPENERQEMDMCDDKVESDLEEEEDSIEIGEVILGFVDKAQASWSLSRQYFPSKAGGTPAWLNPIDIPSGKSNLCDICEQPLHFLLQVYAPIAESISSSAFHRSLFVFMCSSMSCLLRDQHEQWNRGPKTASRSVKVFRSQLPRQNAFYSSNPPNEDGTTEPLVSGVPMCTWCGTWKGDKKCGSCKNARYCSQKHQVMHWKSGHKADCRNPLSSSQCHSFEKIKVTWPEYELNQAAESEFDGESPIEVTQNTLVDQSKKFDDSMASLFNTFQADDEKRCWVSFQDRVSKSPEQVLRYCIEKGSKPLWPLISGRPTNYDILKCRYCGGLLRFEFQVMPQLLYYMGVKNDTESLDWATIVVYTCQSSCDGGGLYGEEFPWIQLWSQSSSS